MKKINQIIRRYCVGPVASMLMPAMAAIGCPGWLALKVARLVHGSVVAYWTAEVATIVEVKPTWSEVTMKIRKLM